MRCRKQEGINAQLATRSTPVKQAANYCLFFSGEAFFLTNPMS